MKKKRIGYPITIYVSAKKKQWFVEPPGSVRQEFKKNHEHGICIYGIDGHDDAKLLNTIKEITNLILTKKEHSRKNM